MPNFIELTGPGSERLPADSVAVPPLGAIEEHGPRLPLSTDFTIASAADATVTEAGGGFGLLPAPPTPKSDEHAWSSGTLRLSWDTVMRTLTDIGNSLAASPVRRLVFLNDHGGNSALLQVASRELRQRFGLRTFLTHPGMPAGQGGASPAGELSMGVHGGRNETSVMPLLRPDLVRLDLAVRSVPERLASYEHIGFGRAAGSATTSAHEAA
ncbi:MAG TPA: creatininase family protein [Amycolatopsis sp.]|uniref:creatininase family protein n=1 Tax=Amycolatopsis sp. TaxID=37632 RepID=UPI002B4A676B|nr:creatininase family protein [Amycolatopsis sp.]HKS44857.1 creatininase family protein [Amycolatopsis sp.]